MFADDPGYTSLFNGKDLTGWKVNENVETFSVKDGAIVSHGPRSHCFYVGDFHNHNFKDFELKVDIMTLPGREWRRLHPNGISGSRLARQRL